MKMVKVAASVNSQRDHSSERMSTEFCKGAQEPLPCPFTLSNFSDSSIDYNINLNNSNT